MSEIDVRIKGGATGRVRAGATVGEVLERLDAGVAGQALVARVEGREVDLATRLEEGPGHRDRARHAGLARGPRRHQALDRASPGGGRAGSLPWNEARHRPGPAGRPALRVLLRRDRPATAHR